MKFIFDDGGRAAAGFKGQTGDCATRAIAIASGRPYKVVYDELNAIAAAIGPNKKGRASHARTGVHRKTYEPYLLSLGAVWTPKMKVGSGCTVHLRADEFPEAGRYVVSLSRHLCAVLDGTVYDIFDPSRDGTRCVYGYYQFV